MKNLGKAKVSRIIARKLNLNWQDMGFGEADLVKVGYGGAEFEERVKQDDVDDLLSSLGL